MLNLKSKKIIYKIKTATGNAILLHLKECNKSFIPPLTKRVDIEEYKNKILEKSITFEAWQGELLVGFIAAYFKGIFDDSAFVTNISVLKSFRGLGIASRLLNMCIKYGRKNNCKELRLEVYKHNNDAIGLYNKFGFINCAINGNIVLMKLKILK